MLNTLLHGSNANYAQRIHRHSSVVIGLSIVQLILEIDWERPEVFSCDRKAVRTDLSSRRVLPHSTVSQIGSQSAADNLCHWVISSEFYLLA